MYKKRSELLSEKRTVLAKERTVYAEERTFLALIRTVVTVIGLIVVIARIVLGETIYTSFIILFLVLIGTVIFVERLKHFYETKEKLKTLEERLEKV